MKPTVAVSTLVDGLLDQVPVLTDRLVERIVAEAASYRLAAAVSPEDLRRSCQDNMVEMLARLGGRPQNPEAPVATGRRRAEQGFPLAEVLHAFRLGGRVIWEELVEHARRGGPAATADLVEVAGSLWAIIDDYSVLVTEAYQQRMSELSRLDAERRSLVVDAVLAGLAAENPSLPEAAAALGLRSMARSWSSAPTRPERRRSNGWSPTSSGAGGVRPPGDCAPAVTSALSPSAPPCPPTS